jgi:hypothetical protein
VAELIGGPLFGWKVRREEKKLNKISPFRRFILEKLLHPELLEESLGFSVLFPRL